MHILYVCTGNICRSTFAERWSRRLAPQGLTFSSAGTMALVGNPMEELMAQELRRRGGDPEGFAARQVSLPILRDADLVLTMERRHKAYVVDEMPSLIRRTHTLGHFLHAVDELAAAGPVPSGAALVDAVSRLRVPSSRAESVEDPYRRGPEKAARAAEQLEAWVGRAVEALSAGGRAAGGPSSGGPSAGGVTASGASRL
ncbi:low molecular weight phosphatase family protein [Kytococcus sedentarius]|uniref:arsenate reductase/protein-tyrosine-phosphatase family protein n=1 Tax=Kytococcus sedentarius TaxID=1276 RepID=UPI0035BC4A31